MVTIKEYKANITNLLNKGTEFLSTDIDQVDKEEISIVVNKLIHIYEYLINDDEVREKAYQIVCQLAMRFDDTLDIILESAKRYNKFQKMEDADLYNPNTYDVLSNIGNGNKKIISYLMKTAKIEDGFPRYEAVKSLCKVNDSLADQIIINMINKRELNDFEIESVINIKGKNFINA